MRELLERLMGLLHHANPTDPKRWHIKPKAENDFNALIRDVDAYLQRPIAQDENKDGTE